MPKKAAPKVSEISRRPIGINVLAGGKCGLPSAYLVYDVLYSDGRSKHESGTVVRAVQTSELLNASGKRKKRLLKAYRPDLFTHIHAAALLLADIEHACLDVDGQLVKQR